MARRSKASAGNDTSQPATVVFIINALNVSELPNETLIKERFEHYKNAWLSETRFSSSMEEVLSNGNYRLIAEMGVAVVPLILKDLEDRPKPWFDALEKITGLDLIKEEFAGELRKMTDVWLQWGRRHALI